MLAISAGEFLKCLQVPIFMTMYHLLYQCKIPIKNWPLKLYQRWPIFKMFAGPIRTNEDQDFDMKITFLMSFTFKFSAKTIARGKSYILRDIKVGDATILKLRNIPKSAT